MKLEKWMLFLKNYKGQLHFRKNYEWDMQNFLSLEQFISLLPSSFDKNIFAQIFSEFKTIKPFFDSLPKQVIHNDIAAHNLLVKGNELKAIIDFSDAAYAPVIQNIAVFLCQTVFSYNSEPKQTELFLKQYQQSNPFSQKEKDLLYDLIRVRFATVVLEFNRWNLDYGVDPQRVEYVEDMYGFLQQFIALGKKEFDKKVFIGV